MKTLLFLFFMMGTGVLFAQSVGASIYTVAPGQAERGDLYVNYDSGVGVRAMRPFGEDGVEQRLGVVYGVSKTVSLLGVAGGVIEENAGFRTSSVQFEVMAEILSQDKYLINVAASAGALREYGGVNVLMARLALGRTFQRWDVNGNMVLEKPYADNRDAVDVITTFSASWQASRRLHLGLDVIGEDLEGFFEEEEAEGGAKVMFGPTLYFQASDKMHLRLGGGPIYYLTSSTPVSQAPRILPPGDSGYMVRFSMIYGI